MMETGTTLSPRSNPTTGLRIFVDGFLEASDASLNWSRSVNSYLRIGGDRVAGWPNQPSSAYFDGTVDEVALYLHPLNSAQISLHADLMLGRVGTPTGVVAEAIGPEAVEVTWSPVVGADSYEIRRDGEPVGVVTDVRYSESGLIPGTSYTYTVTALRSGVAGGESAPVSVTTPGQPVEPVSLLVSGSVWRYETSGVAAAGLAVEWV